MNRKVEREPRLREGKRGECDGDRQQKTAWIAPKLEFVKPRLTSHGKLEDVTGFFGSFTP